MKIDWKAVAATVLMIVAILCMFALGFLFPKP
jgi:hypothetical protein